jgi:hypothetical protein
MEVRLRSARHSNANPLSEEDIGMEFTRALLFVSSYAPVFAIASIRFRGIAIASVCAALAIVGMLVVVLAVVWLPRRVARRHVQAFKVEDTSGEVSAYLAGYLLPFVVIAEPGWRDVVGFAIFFLVAARLALVARLELLNPMVYLVGRRVLRVSLATGPAWLITRGDVPDDGFMLEVSELLPRLFVQAPSVLPDR